MLLTQHFIFVFFYGRIRNECKRREESAWREAGQLANVGTAGTHGEEGFGRAKSSKNAGFSVRQLQGRWLSWGSVHPVTPATEPVTSPRLAPAVSYQSYSCDDLYLVTDQSAAAATAAIPVADPSRSLDLEGGTDDVDGQYRPASSFKRVPKN